MIPQSPQQQTSARQTTGRPTLQSCRQWLYSNWLLIFLLTVCITRLWLMPLPSSFWTDEIGTAFVVQRPADPSLAAVPRLL